MASPLDDNFRIEIPGDNIVGLDFDRWLDEVFFTDPCYCLRWWEVEARDVLVIKGHASQASITRIMALAQGHNQ